MDFSGSDIIFITLTLGVYLMARRINRRTHLSVFNPILITIICLIVLLTAFGIDYETYCEGGKYIDFWLKPAIVALGVPLYKQLETIKHQTIPLLLSELAGCIVGAVSVVIVAELLGASREVVLSLAPKAVTTPIAMEVASVTGGIPPLTSAVVICTGIFGSIVGFRVLQLGGVKSSIAAGLSIGTAAHAIGTAGAMEKGSRYGTFSSLGLIMNGLLTALLAPFILRFMGY